MLFPETKQIAERLLADRAAVFQSHSGLPATDLFGSTTGMAVAAGCACVAVAAMAVGGLWVSNRSSAATAGEFLRRGSFSDAGMVTGNKRDRFNPNPEPTLLSFPTVHAVLDTSPHNPNTTNPYERGIHRGASSGGEDVSSSSPAGGVGISTATPSPVYAYPTPAESRFMNNLQTFGNVEQSIRFDESAIRSNPSASLMDRKFATAGRNCGGIGGSTQRHSYFQPASAYGGFDGRSDGGRSGIEFFSSPEAGTSFNQERL